MPTAAKLFAAVLIAALGYYGGDTIMGHLPEEIPGYSLRLVAAFFGILVGWRFLGKRVGGGMQSAIGLGISAAAALVIVCTIWFSGYEMVKRAIRKAYGGNPFEGLQDMVQIALEYSQYLAHGDVIGVLVVGGAVAGMICEMVSRRWP